MVNDEPITLSERELDVLELVAFGCPDKLIARLLKISQHTVGQHLRHIFAKVDANSRAEAVAKSYVGGILCPVEWPPLRGS